ncbi:conjugative relaxase domain-containing protein, TrwC/TraI family [Paraburkholderia phenazinium]|uniref:Conjugative relaxase domain-containing protein, TrwC/TraI family n=1 Tax=Paraburkholderia phenazinium TaxID=60549 RepID=A0A1G7Y7B7_9BURK|nr:MobF family relaxase [Paraburkholderia phenazinium]SDG92213.1 conjugative relaxase domain-containing protein, TrwC/TraI family [Paraburkholderia phenazinium]
MLTSVPLSPRGHDKNGNNIINYFLAKEARYYVNEITGLVENQTRWFGKGTEALGLSGHVDERTLLNLLNGKLPDGTKGVQNVGKAGRRAAFDLCVTEDKSVSMLMADPTATPEEREAIIAAHQRAAAKMMAFVEQELYARIGKAGCQIVSDVGMIAAAVTHFSNRDLDPNLHTHFMLMNMVTWRDAEGKLHVTTFENSTLMAIKHAAGAVHRNEMAREMQGMGYKVNKHIQLDAKGRETGDVFYRVAGIDDFSRNAHSKRRMAILAYMEAHPDATEDVAAAATRKDKDEPTIQELRKLWAKEFQERRANFPNVYQSVAELKGEVVTSNLSHKDLTPVKGVKAMQDMNPKSDAEVLAKIHEPSSLFNRYELMKQVAFEYVGRLDMRGVIAKTDEILNDLKQVLAFEHDPKTGLARYASKAMVDLEANILKKAAARADEANIRLSKDQVDEGLAKFKKAKPHLILSEEQEGSVRYICSNTGGCAIISGRAGTGKTTSFIATKITWEAAGGTIIGVSDGWKAAKKLQSESGVESYSTQTTLHRIKTGKLILDSRTMLCVDEAGMQTSQSIAKLQDLCDAAGAKLVLMGDHLQLQPVGAGSGFRIMQRTISDHALTDIRRQRSSDDRLTANMLYDEKNGAKIFERYLKNGHIRTAETEQEARAMLVRDYFKTEGVVEPETVMLRVNGQMREVEVAPNDQLVFSAGNKTLGIAANDTAEVKAMTWREDGKGLLMEVEVVPSDLTKTKHTVTIDTATFQDFNRDYAQTLVICGTNKEVQEMNDEIRAGFKERGILGDQDHRVRLIVNREWRQVKMATGDKVMFSEKHDWLGVVNGEGGIITALKPSSDGKSHLMTIRLVSEIPEQNGRYVSFDTKDMPDMTLAYSGSVHKSQGQSINKTLHFVGEAGLHMVNNQSALVAFTREKREYGMYGRTDDLLGNIQEDGARHGGIMNQLVEQALNVTTMDVQQITREKAEQVVPQQRGQRSTRPRGIPISTEPVTREEQRADAKAKGIAQAAQAEDAARKRLAAGTAHVNEELRTREAANERDAQATQRQSGFVQAAPDLAALAARRAAARTAYEARQKAEAQVAARRAAEQAAAQKTVQERKLEAQRQAQLAWERENQRSVGRSR